MKNKVVKILLLVIGLYVLIDYMSEGLLLELISTVFTEQYEYLDTQNILHQVSTFHWQRIKIAGLLILLTAVFIGKLMIDKNVEKQRKRHFLQTEKMLRKFKQHGVLDDEKAEYAEIKNILMQISEEQQHQIRVLELQTRQKNDLISYLAHDMKTPLASVIGYLSLLQDVQDVPEKQRQHYIDITLDKATRLESLIDEFFDITRFNLHDMTLTKGRMEVLFMFQQLCEQFYPICIAQNKEIKLVVAQELILYADADKLARAFNNILKNAISYSYEHTAIVIETQIQEGNLKILFHNQGDEIPQQKLCTIFEKFYRLDQARSTNVGGAGLGLAIAKEIIEAHGGNIQATSSREETVFEVLLPFEQ